MDVKRCVTCQFESQMRHGSRRRGARPTMDAQKVQVLKEAKELKDIMLQCWEQDPENRPVMEELVDELQELRRRFEGHKESAIGALSASRAASTTVEASDA